MLHDRSCAIGGDIGDRNVMRPCSLEIYVVIAGCAFSHIANLRELFEDTFSDC